MPKCIVDYCRNYAGMRKNLTNVILHGFPTTLERIKLWLRAIEQSGQRFDDLDEMAERIREGKKYDSYRVCSEHFTIQCYFVNGDKKTLKKESIPTVFANRVALAQFARKHLIRRRRQEPLNILDKIQAKTKAPESLKENKEVPKPKQDCKKKTQKLKNGQELAQKLLNITLEIIGLLTGEDYIVVKKSCPQVKLDRRTLCSKMVPQSQMLDWVNRHKILELTNNIIELLTEEEQNDMEGHNEASSDVEMESPQNLSSPGVEETYTAHPWLSFSECPDVETVIVQDVQELRCFNISTWTTISEANGTKKLVLREEAITQDGAPNIVQNVVEEPFVSGGGNLKVYTHEEPLPCRPENRPHTDLYIHVDSAQSIKERPPSQGIMLPSDHVEHGADHKEPVKFESQNGIETDLTGQSDHKRDSSTHITGETQSLPSLDHLPYTSIVIKEEALSPTVAKLRIPDTPPQCTGPIFKEELLTHTDVSAAGHQSQITCTKEEPGSCGEENLPQSTIHSSNTYCITYITS